MNLHEVDWESLEKVWGFLFEDTRISRDARYVSKKRPDASEKLVILVSAYEKFEELICK